VTCSDIKVALGAYVLGALDPVEGRQVEEHLRGCPACAAEQQELRALAALLGTVDPDDLRAEPVALSPDLFARTSAAAAAGKYGRSGPSIRSRTWALVAAVVLAVLGIGAGITVWATGSGGQTASASAGPVRVTVTASEAKSGSALEVTVAGLRPGEVCHLMAVDHDGQRHDAGDWPASKAGDGTWVGWTKLEPDAVAGAVILGHGGRELAHVTF
jgi:anti-sigma factor RsiW